jgi:uncharacterized protein (DUF433 family)
MRFCSLEGSVVTSGTIIPINHIGRKSNSDKYRIVGKGVTVEFLSLFMDDAEWPVARICAEYGLTPAEVFAAWSFYHDHQDEIDRHLAEAVASETTRRGASCKTGSAASAEKSRPVMLH